MERCAWKATILPGMAYLPQFPSLVPEFEGQYVEFKKALPNTVELIDGGIEGGFSGGVEVEK